ncbi:MAG: S-layer family protein [Candidatus Omnitrophica bacterium]|nr:S-layer family protein [Candidatus Omnitrophota bacterium]
MKRILALITAITFATNYCIPISFAELVIMDQSGNPAATQSDGVITNIDLLGGNSYHTPNLDIPVGQTFNFNVLGADGIANPVAPATLNVTGGQPTFWDGVADIVGSLSVYNPFGFNLGATSQVNVAGTLILSTLGDISMGQFLNNMGDVAKNPFDNRGPKIFTFDQDPAFKPSPIINEGTIDLAPGSRLALIAGAVRNDGIINADDAAAVLAAGQQVTLDFSGDGLISVSIDKPIEAPVYDFKGNKINDAIANSGKIKADGGLVILSAAAVEEAFDNIINHSGIIEANSISSKNGRIVLDGGDDGITRVSGTLNAKGNDLGEKGGTIEVLGEKVGLFGGATVDVSGYNGGGTALIGGDYQGQGSVRNADATYVDFWAKVNADALLEGDGGKIVVWSDKSTRAYGSFSAKGGALSGDGGLIETSSANFLDVDGASVDASASNGKAGTWLLDPYLITISNLVSTLVFAGGAFTGGANSNVKASDINSKLNAGTSVTVTTSAADGDIELVAGADVSKSSVPGAVIFTLNATRDILINGTIGGSIGGIVQVVLNAARNLSINNTIATSSGKITLNSTGGDVLFSAAGDVTSTSGEIEVSAFDAITMTDGAVLDAGSGIIDFDAGGDITLGRLVTTSFASDAAVIRTTGGQIIDGGDTGGPNIQTAGFGSATVTLDAETGIGNGGNAIEVRTQYFSAVTDQGDINVRSEAGAGNVGNLHITSANGVNGVSITDSGNLNAGSDINLVGQAGSAVNAPIINNNGGDISFAYGGNLDNEDMTVNSVNIQTFGGNGNITLYAGDDINLNGNSVVSAAGTGDITLYTGENFLDGVVDFDGNSQGDLAMADGSAIRSEAGDVVINTLRNAAIGEINTDSDAAGAKGDVTINALSGGVTDSNTGLNITANDLVINSVTGIGVPGSAHIDTAVDTLNVVNTTSGGIGILETAGGGDLDVIRINQGSNGVVNVQTTAGAMNVLSAGSGGLGVSTTSGELTLAGVGNLSISHTVTSTSGKINLDSLAGDVNFSAAGDVTSTSGEIEINAFDDITMADGTVLNAGSGILDLDADGDITLGRLVTSSFASDAAVIRTTGGEIIDGGDADGPNVQVAGFGGATITLDAQTGIGNGGNAIEVRTVQFSAVTDQGDINARSQAGGGGNVGGLNITNANGVNGVSITDSANLNAGSDITLVGQAGSAVNAPIINNNGGDISFAYGGNLDNEDMTVNNVNIQTFGGNGNITLYAGDDINLNGNSVVSTEGTGDINLYTGENFLDGVLDHDGNGQGDLNMASGASIQTQAGDVTIDAIRNINVTTVNLDSDAAGAKGDLTMTAVLGAIDQPAGAITADDVVFTSAGATTLDQAANSFNTIDGSAGGVINVADSGSDTVVKDLQTVGNVINYDHTGAGDVSVTGTISSGNAGTNGGNIEINSSNFLTIENTATVSSKAGAGGVVTITGAIVNGVIDVGAGDITLTGTGLDVIITSPILSAVDVILSALRDIIIQNSITTTSGSGANVQLTADSDLNGEGGVWLQTAGSINSDGNVILTGSDIFGKAGNESIVIDADGANDQILAKGDITIQGTGLVPGSDITIDGKITTTGVGETITVDSDGAINTSDDGSAELFGDNLILNSVEGSDVEIDGDNVSFNNTTSGDVSIEDMAGGLTVTGAANGGGTTNILTHSPLTIAADMIQAATINLTAGESGAAGDDLTINAGVTVNSTGDAVTLRAGDDVIFGAGSDVKSDTSSTTLTAGFGDTDGLGSISAGGLVSASTTAFLSAVTSIIDNNAGANNIAAASLDASAATGIDLDTDVTNLTAVNTGAGNINLDEANGANVLNVAASNGDATVTTATGDLNITNLSSTGTTTATATAGAIHGVTDDGAADVSGDIVNLNANAGGIRGAGASDALDVTATTSLNADTSGDNGNIALDSIGNAIVGLITTGSLTAGVVTLDSTGSINGASYNGVADIFGKTINLIANGPIGSPNALEISAGGSTINADTTATGDAINLDSLVNAVIGLITTGGAGNVTVNSDGKIDSAANNGTADVVGNVVTLNAAVGGIGTSSAVDVTATTQINADTAAGDDSNIFLDSIGNMPVGLVNAGLGNVTLNSTGNINDALVAETANVIGGTINLNTTGSDIGALADYFDVEPSTVWNASTNGGAAYINCLGSNCALGTIDLGTGTFYHTAAGTIKDGNDDLFGENNGATVNIIAGGAVLEAGTGIGEDLGGGVIDGIEMRLADYNANAGTDGRLEADAGTGPAFLSNLATTGAGLTIGGIGALADGISAQGGIKIWSGSPLTVGTDVNDTGGGDIELAAFGTAAADDLNLDANVNATGGNGNINLYAGDDINVNGTSAVSAAGTGNVTVRGGEDFSDGTVDQDGNAASDVTMASGSALRSANGNITINTKQNIAISEVNADSNAAGAQGDVTITTTGGAVSDSNAGTLNVTGDNLEINSVNGVATLANSIETEVITLDITNSTSGQIVITETAAGGDLDIVNIAQSAAGDVNIQTTDGQLTVLGSGSGVSATSGELTLGTNGAANDLVINQTVTTTSGKINLDSASDDVRFDADGDVSSTSGEIEIDAADDVVMVNGTVLNAGSGIVDVDAGDDVTIGSLQTTSNATDAVVINAGGDVIDGGDTDVDILTGVSGTTTISAGIGIGDSDALETETGNLSAVTETGNIEIDNTGALNIVTANGVTGVSITDAGANDNLSAILISAASPLTVNSTVINNDGGDIELYSLGSAATDDITLNANVETHDGDGNILLVSGDTTAISSGVAVSADNSGIIAVLTGEDANTGILDFDGSSTGDLVMDNGSAIRTEEGIIFIAALRNARITEVNANSDNDATQGSVFIGASTGFISDRNGSDTNITGDEAILFADKGIGDGAVADDDEIETDLNVIDVENVTSGHINIVEVDAGGALDIVNADQQGGGDLNIRTVDGTLTVLAAGAGGLGVSATSGETTLVAQDAGGSFDDDLVVNDTVISTTGKINLDSTSDDVLFSEEGDVTSTSGEIEVEAFDEITMTDTGADSTILNAGIGRIDLDADGNITLASVKTTSTLDDAVTIVSRSGAIIDAGDTDGFNIRTGALAEDPTVFDGGMILSAETGIGSTNALETKAGKLAAITDTGNIQIANTGALDITTLTDPDAFTGFGFAGAGTVVGASIIDSGATNPAGFILITAASPMLISSAVTNNAGGNITLASLGAAATDDMTINANIGTNGGNGDVLLTAGDTVTQAATTIVSATGTGDITVAAGEDFTDGVLDQDGNTGASGGDINMLHDPATNTTATVQTDAGNILMDAADDFNVGVVNTDANADNVRGDVTTFSRAGSTLDSDTSSKLNITADDLTMFAAGSIGIGGDPIEVTANTIAATAILGPIVITNFGSMIVNLLSGGGIIMAATGDIVLGHAFAPNGNVDLSAGGSILSQGGPDTRVIADSFMSLVAGGVIGTAANPINTQLNHPGNLFVQAGSAINGLSTNITGNFSPFAVTFGTLPPGLALFNGVAIGGQTINLFNAALGTIFTNPLPYRNAQYGAIDGRYAADFPGQFNSDPFATAPTVDIDTSALDALVPVLLPVVPIPEEAVPTVPTEEEQKPVPQPQAAPKPPVQPEEEGELVPPPVVPIPAEAQPVEKAATTDQNR